MPTREQTARRKRDGGEKEMEKERERERANTSEEHKKTNKRKITKNRGKKKWDDNMK